jgi:ketosteroid isomerase-like protein
MDINEDYVVAVERAERALAQAHLDMDLEAIAAALHPDYIIIQPGGAIETREQVLASYRGGGRRWDEAQVSDLQARIYEDTAVVVGRWQARGGNQGQPFDYSARFLSVWVSTAGGWKNVAYQATEIPDQPIC